LLVASLLVALVVATATAVANNRSASLAVLGGALRLIRTIDDARQAMEDRGANLPAATDEALSLGPVVGDVTARHVSNGFFSSPRRCSTAVASRVAH